MLAVGSDKNTKESFTVNEIGDIRVTTEITLHY